MDNWRNEIINRFLHISSPVVLVKDPDFILGDLQIQNKLQGLGYDIVRYEDSISFRFLYEKEYRKRVETKLLAYTNEPVEYPFEFIKKGTIVTISINTVFPKFSASIIRQMNPEDLDALFAVHAQYQGSSSNKETLENIVKHMYKIPYELIDSEAELYKLLLSVHYSQRDLPIIVQDFLIEKLTDKLVFRELPISDLISSSGYFYSFIEEEWKNFVESFIAASNEQIHDPLALYHSHYFTNGDVRRLMNDLFIEGILSKVKAKVTEHMPAWMKHGIDEDSSYSLYEKLEKLKKKLFQKLEDIKGYKDWLEIMDIAAEYKQSLLESSAFEDIEADEIMVRINSAFQDWMIGNYHSISSLAPYPKPKMVHHVPHTISTSKEKNEKVALLVLDGMSFIQWKQIRKYLKTEGFSFEENGIFAWIPTLTSISRQAIFSGNIPLTFSSTLKTTAFEEKSWKAFWENHGTLKQYVGYQKGLGREAYDRNNFLGLRKSSLKIYGAVIDIIDNFSHHAVMGEQSLVSSLTHWLESNYLVQLLHDLKKDNYTIYLTSDHGNTKATGIGRVSEGVLVDQKGERVRIYNDKILYDSSASAIESLPWSNTGLPKDYYVLLAPYGKAFVTRGEKIISHGGISIEEVIVPFVKVL